MVSQRGPARDLNPRPRHIPATGLPLDYFLEHSGVGRLFPQATPQGLTEHHQGGLPAPYCRARKGRPRRIFAHVLAHRATRLSFRNPMKWGELHAAKRHRLWSGPKCADFGVGPVLKSRSGVGILPRAGGGPCRMMSERGATPTDMRGRTFASSAPGCILPGRCCPCCG